MAVSFNPGTMTLHPADYFKAKMEDFYGQSKQSAAARRNVKKSARAAKRKHSLKRLPKKTRRALGQQASKVRKAKR
jgi:hypothetical protein